MYQSKKLFSFTFKDNMTDFLPYIFNLGTNYTLVVFH